MRYQWKNPSLLILISLWPWRINGKLNGLMKDIHGSKKKKKKHESDPSVSSTPSIWFTFFTERTIARIREGPFNEGFTQWHNYRSVHLAIFDHLWVFQIVSRLNSVERTNSEEAGRGRGRISEKREKGTMITLILSLLTLLLICETWQF